MKTLNYTDLYLVNNCSYQSGGKDKNIMSSNKVDNIKVAINVQTNDFFDLKNAYSSYISKELKCDNDLYINSLNLEEYDNVNGLPIYNLIAEIRSKSNCDLISLWNDFNNSILVYDYDLDEFDIVLEKESNVKRVYPLVIQTDENNYLMLHNFFNGPIHINKNPSNKYVMHLITPRTDKIIANMLHAKFGKEWLHISDSLEELIDMFYKGFV